MEGPDLKDLLKGDYDTDLSEEVYGVTDDFFEYDDECEEEYEDVETEEWPLHSDFGRK